MTTRVDVEEIETTKGEKLLATILAGFLLVGVLWIYFHIDVERDHFARTPVSAAARSALDRPHRAAAPAGAAPTAPRPGWARRDGGRRRGAARSSTAARRTAPRSTRARRRRSSSSGT